MSDMQTRLDKGAKALMRLIREAEQAGASRTVSGQAAAFRVGITCPSTDTVTISGAELIGPQG